MHPRSSGEPRKNKAVEDGQAKFLRADPVCTPVPLCTMLVQAISFIPFKAAQNYVIAISYQ